MAINETTYHKYLKALKTFNFMCDQLDRMANQEGVKEESIKRQEKLLELKIKELADLEAKLIEIDSIDYKRTVINGRIEMQNLFK